MTKICVGCKQEKPISDFPVRPGKRKGEIRSRCRPCYKEYMRNIRKKSSAKARRDPIRGQRIRDSNNASRRRHRGKQLVRLRQYRAENPDKYRQYNTKRRKLLKGAKQEPYTKEELVVRDAGICQICNKPVESADGMDPMGPTIDHIQPLSKGGDDTLANVQLAHRKCNGTKGALWI